jgi:elongation factor 1 alpha-like protein
MDDDYDYDSGSQGEEEFNEDSLTNEEYDQLHDVLPELRARLESYNDTIPEFAMKQALYYNYYELEPAITELKSQFKKLKLKKVNESFSGPSPDDVVLNAQDQAFDKKLQDLSISGKQPKTNVKLLKETKPFKTIDLKKELHSNPTYSKPHKSYVVIGHVDAGKSTLMGRMLYDYGIVDAKTVNKLVKESERAGKGSFALAWIMDQTSEERSHGVTVDICATDFETPNARFTAIDAPGHKDFVPQMIGGVSQADVALLVVDSISGEFEAGFSLDGQTKEHTILAKNLGIEKIVVAVNKLDKEDWNEFRFNSIKQQMTEFLESSDVGFTADQIEFVPISGLTGNNVVKRDDSVEAFSWYKGPTLGSLLENIKLSTDMDEDSADRLLKENFFLSVHDSYKDSGSIKVSGKISSGIIQAGETIVAAPSQEVLQVQSLKVSNKPVDFAIKGDLVQMSFKASQLSNDSIEAFRIGDLISKIGSPVKIVKKLQVQLHLFNLTKPLLVGTPFVLFRNNCQVPARITQLVEVLNGKKKKKLLHLVSKQSAIVDVEVQGTSLPLTKYDDNRILGRIVIRREGITIGAGKVLDFIE